MGQKFGDFTHMSLFAGLLEEIEKSLQRPSIVPDVANDRVEVLQNLHGAGGEQRFRVFAIKLKRVLIVAGLHQAFSHPGNSLYVVMDGKQFVSERHRVSDPPGFQIGLQQIPKSVRMGIEIGHSFQVFGRPCNIARFERIAAK